MLECILGGVQKVNAREKLTEQGHEKSSRREDLDLFQEVGARDSSGSHKAGTRLESTELNNQEELTEQGQWRSPRSKDLIYFNEFELEIRLDPAKSSLRNYNSTNI